MGISVEGQKCPICKAYLFDNDDLVFCPECGAPHHRDCYAALGHCAYKDKHGTSEGYKKPENKTSENNAENATTAFIIAGTARRILSFLLRYFKIKIRV